MTLLQLRTLTLDWLDDPNAGYFSTSTVNLRLNLALRELQKRLISANKEYYAKCVQTDTVADQKAYALPSDFMQILRIERIAQGVTNNFPYFKLDAITPNERDQLIDEAGAPVAYYMQQNNIMLVPTPDAAYDIHLEYAYYVADMASDSDVPDAPAQFHEYIAVLATRDCLIKDGRPLEPITAKLKDYETLLKQIADQRQADGPRMVVMATSNSWGDF